MNTVTVKMSCVLLLATVVTEGHAQTVLLRPDSVRTTVGRASVTPVRTYFMLPGSTQTDSIATALLSTVQLPDGQQFMIIPDQLASTKPSYTTAVFIEALRNHEWRKLWQSTSAWTSLSLQVVDGKLRLTATSRERLRDLANALRIAPTAHLALTMQAAMRPGLKEQRQQQASLIKAFLMAQGVKPAQFTVNGQLDSGSPNAPRTAILEGRLLVSFIAVDKLTVVYAAPYVPTRPPLNPVQSQTVAGGPTDSQTLSTSGSYKTQSKGRAYRRSMQLYATGNKALAGVSASWVDPRAGVGMNKGIGGGISVHWLVGPKLGIGFTADYAQWQVERRFFEQDVQEFSSQQQLRRAALFLQLRMYTGGNFYVQPMGGWQLLQLSQSYSDSFPGATASQTIWANRPAVGAGIGYELRGSELNAGRWLLDIGLHYQLTPNTAWRDLAGSLHYVGMRAGIGWTSKPPLKRIKY